MYGGVDVLGVVGGGTVGTAVVLVAVVVLEQERETCFVFVNCRGFFCFFQTWCFCSGSLSSAEPFLAAAAAAESSVEVAVMAAL